MVLLLPLNSPAKKCVSWKISEELLCLRTFLAPSPIGCQPSLNVMSCVNLTVNPLKLLPALTASLKPSSLSSELIS